MHTMKCWFCLFSWAMLAGVFPAASAATYPVGPGRTYTTLQAVVNLLQPGDLVEVDGDVTYPGGVVFRKPGTAAQPITIRGVRVNGRRPVLSGGTNTVQFMTVWFGPGDDRADHYVFEGFEVTGGTSRGIFHQADDLVLRDVLVHHCPKQGILGADWGSGSLWMEYCEVHHCGGGEGDHQIYIATDEGYHPGSVFRMQHCYVHDGNGGNSVKSRAERNEIYYNWIEGGYYHELDLIGSEEYDEPVAREDSDVVGNVIWKKTIPSGYTDYWYVARVGGDGTGDSYGRFRFVNNTILCGGRAVFRIHYGIESVEMHNNVFWRVGGGPVTVFTEQDIDWRPGQRTIGGSGNWVPTGSSSIPAGWIGTLTGADPGFADLAGGDLSPAGGSPLLDHGTSSPASPPGYPFPNPLFPPAFLPDASAQAPGTAQPRAVDGAIDIGAFEHGSLRTLCDFNRDGRTDILWRNTATGDAVVWMMNGAAPTSTRPLPLVDPVWFLTATGDFDGDGAADLLWCHSGAGYLSVWFMDGTAVRETRPVSSVPVEWRVAAAPDLDADGKCDILWRHASNGSNAVWYMDGAAVTGSAALPAVDTAWELTSAADFDGDGVPDLLWRHPSSGNNVVWFLDGLAVTGSALLQAVPAPWDIAATGDFDGDSQTDILWRNGSTGDTVIWFMSGTAVIDDACVQQVPAPWAIAN
ncbi:MAG: FG-GAP repeat protein [Acidobacteria bacterium]|nr:FG-GAP repeat protein [Acidobacteriota bacterium]